MTDRPLALVTGGAIRLGAAISRALSDAGYRVLIHARGHADEARALARELDGDVHLADLMDRAAIDGLFDAIAARHGRLDVLINNAAIFEGAAPEAVTADQWDRHLALNLTAPFLCCQRAAPLLRAGDGGAIVNLLDISSTRPYRGYSHYSATKAGLLALTHGLAAEWAPEIRVNGVSPGAALMPEWYTEADRAARLVDIPMGEEPGAGAIAEAVRFLVTGPRGITGEVIAVDGGRSARW